AEVCPEAIQAVRDPRFRGAQSERQRNQLLLSSVVEIALDPAPRFVGSGDHPGAGGGKLAAAFGVRNRSREQVGELLQTSFEISRRWGGPRGADRDRSPESTLDYDGYPDAVANSLFPRGFGNGSLHVRKKVGGARRPTSRKDPCDGARVVFVETPAGPN